MTKVSKEDHRKLMSQCRLFDANGGRGRKIAVTDAVHWLRDEPIRSALTKKKTLLTIACGYQASERSRHSRSFREVTCLDCMKLAIGE